MSLIGNRKFSDSLKPSASVAPGAMKGLPTVLRASAALPASKDWWTSAAIDCNGARFASFEGLVDVNAANNQIAWMLQGTMDPVGTASPVWVSVNIANQANGADAADVIPGHASAQPVANVTVGPGEVFSKIYANTGNSIPLDLSAPDGGEWSIVKFRQIRLCARQVDAGTAPDLAVRYTLSS